MPTFLDLIRNAIRSFIITRETANVVDDIVNNGLTPADEAVIDAYLAQVA